MLFSRRWFVSAGVAALAGCSPEAVIDPILAETMKQPTRLFVDASWKWEVSPELRVGEKTCVLISIGQSLAGNHSGGNYARRQNVHNLCVQTGRLYWAGGRLLGCSYLPDAENNDNFLTRLGDLLIKDGRYDRVILVPMAVSGSTISSWSRGVNRPLITVAGKRLRQHRWHGADIVVTQQQGESDHQTSRADYEADQRAVIDAFREEGINGDFYVAHSTILGGVPSLTVRDAQRAVIEGGLARKGPDTDILGSEYRYDQTHLNEAGAQENARMWLASLT